MTLLGYKESTKDVDLLLPETTEHGRLISFLRQAGYEPITSYGWKRPDEVILFDIYEGNRVYSTELLSSPLEEGGHRKICEWNKIYLGALNPMDLIISKMFRGDEVDIQDSLLLMEKERVNLKRLETRYRATAKYDVGEEKVLRNFERLRKRLKKDNQ